MQCYTGEGCETKNEECVVVVHGGDPLIFEPFWEEQQPQVRRAPVRPVSLIFTNAQKVALITTVALPPAFSICW